MMGKTRGLRLGFPTPMQMGQTFVQQLSDPFYDGPNDKGIADSAGLLAATRVGPGFLLAVLVADSGFDCMSPPLRRVDLPHPGARRLSAAWTCRWCLHHQGPRPSGIL
jgi:hypothetical protein